MTARAAVYPASAAPIGGRLRARRLPVAAAAGVLAGSAVMFLPALAAAGTPTGTVTPATGLTDGQVIAVRAAGLTPNRTVQIEECEGTTADPPRDNTACDGLTLDTQATTDSQGTYSNAPGDRAGNTGYQVYVRPSPLLNAPTSISCDRVHACLLYIGVDQNDFSAPHVFVEITFAALAPATAQAPATSAAAAKTAAPAPTAVPAKTPAPATAAPPATTPAPGTVAPAPARAAGVDQAAFLSAGSGPASFALTGAPDLVPWAAAGLLIVVSASGARRRALRPLTRKAP